MAEKQKIPRPSGRGCRTQLLHRLFVGLCEQGHQTSDAWSNTLVMSRSRYLQQSGACAQRYDIFKVTWGGSAIYLYRYKNIYNNKANYPWVNGSGERRVSLRLTSSHLISRGPTWTYSTSLGLLWIHLTSLGLTSTHWDSLGLDWPRWNSLGCSGTHLIKCWLSCFFLTSVGFTWAHLNSCCISWIHWSPKLQMLTLGDLGITDWRFVKGVWFQASNEFSNPASSRIGSNLPLSARS